MYMYMYNTVRNVVTAHTYTDWRLTSLTLSTQDLICEKACLCTCTCMAEWGVLLSSGIWMFWGERKIINQSRQQYKQYNTKQNELNYMYMYMYIPTCTCMCIYICMPEFFPGQFSKTTLLIRVHFPLMWYEKILNPINSNIHVLWKHFHSICWSMFHHSSWQPWGVWFVGKDQKIC